MFETNSYYFTNEIIVFLFIFVILIAIVVCFFILVYNVNQIKRSLNGNNRPNDALFIFYLSIGNKEKAKTVLERQIINELLFLSSFYSTTSDKVTAREELIKKYEPLLKQVDQKFDFNKADELLNILTENSNF